MVTEKRKITPEESDKKETAMLVWAYIIAFTVTAVVMWYSIPHETETKHEPEVTPYVQQ